MLRDREPRPIRLPELPRFNEALVAPGEALDTALAATPHKIACFTSNENMAVALQYAHIIGRGLETFAVRGVENPIEAAIGFDIPDAIPLVLHSATDPQLFARMFKDGPALGQLNMGELYVPQKGHESSALYVVGVANKGLALLGKEKPIDDPNLVLDMKQRRREMLGEEIITSDDFRKILQSSSVRKVSAHALGPKGTNIAQAMTEYIHFLGIEEKTQLIVHPRGIEPLAYAEMAREEVEPGVIPIHMECDVYYDMGKLYAQRNGEVVFADQHYMLLDAMQVASKTPLEALAATGRKMRVATHPTPRPIISEWEKRGIAEWIKATSNSAAAEMVANGEVDACITTGTTMQNHPELTRRHMIGSPMMLFTIGTPLNQAQLRGYLSRV